MRFENEENFVKYTQVIPAFFIIIWLYMSYYVPYIASKQPDIIAGRIYRWAEKGGDVYLTLTEEILWWGSIILAATSMFILQLIKLHFWGDEKN